jgi:ribonucleoside-diphosphate reductase alpha chain
MAIRDTACNLASLNLIRLLLQSGHVDIENFEHAVRIWTTVLDITVTAAGYPSEEIAEGSRNYRTLGLGYSNLGAYLMRQGVPYDSAEARTLTGHITALMQYNALITSAEIASELQPFPRYEANKEHVERVVWNHAVYGMQGANTDDYRDLTFRPVPLYENAHFNSLGNLRTRVRQLAEKVIATVKQHGLRNAQLTLLAPNGTIGLLMDCDTTGIEPDFALVKWKKLAGGGFFKIINQSIPDALRKLGYNDEQVEQIHRYAVGYDKFPSVTRDLFLQSGIPEAVVAKAEASLRSSMKLADCFGVHVIGKDEYVRMKIKSGEAANYLAEFGFKTDWINEHSPIICGHMTVEGCPVLKDEHLPVFDCANKCGKIGKRFLSMEAHVDMMAAAQPVLSGAISKTINFPLEATPEEFRRMAFYSWRRGLKAAAPYRDGAKMSQPLNTDSDDNEELDLTDSVTAQQLAVQPPQSKRRKLPNKVRGERTKFAIQGGNGRHKFYLRTGEYPDGRLGEIFIDCAKEGAMLRGIMNTVAMAVSIGLQHDVPLETFVEAFTHTKFEPNGPIVGHDRLKRCDSIIDAIFRELAITYLKREDLAHVQVEEVDRENGFNIQPYADKAIDHLMTEIEKSQLAVFTQGLSVKPTLIGEQSSGNYAAVSVAEARAKGYTGNQCPRCKSFALVRSGFCEKCDNCGEQSGCA